MSLERFLSLSGGPTRELAVANRTQPQPFQQMVENLFADQAVTVGETTREEYPRLPSCCSKTRRWLPNRRWTNSETHS